MPRDLPGLPLPDPRRAFADALAEAPIGIAITELTGRFVYVNRVYEGLLGYTLTELSTNEFIRVTHPRDRRRNQRLIQQMVSGVIPGFVIEKRYLRKDGTVVWVRNSVTAIRDESGAPAYIVGIVEPLENLLRRSWTTLTTVSPRGAPVLVTDGAGFVKDCNPEFVVFLGYTRRELIARSPVHVFARSLGERPGWRRFLRHGTIGRAMTARGVLLLNKEGARQLADIRVTPVRGPSGALYAAIWRFMPIGEDEEDTTSRPPDHDRSTRARTIEASAWANVDRLRISAGAAQFFASAGLRRDEALRGIASFLATNLGDWCLIRLLGPTSTTLEPVAMAHPDLLIESECLARTRPVPLNGTIQGAVVATRSAILVPEISPPAALALLGECHEDSSSVPFPINGFLISPLRVGSRVIGTITLCRDHPGNPFTFEDQVLLEGIADRIGLTLELQRAYEAEQRTNQGLERIVEARTRELRRAIHDLDLFVATVAHDLRAPLRTLEALAKITLEDHREEIPDLVVERIASIQGAAQRMGRLVEDLQGLAQSTYQAMTWEPVDISALARSVAAELEAASPERRVEFRIEDGLVALGHPGLLRIVLANLMENAFKFTREKPQATITVGSLQVAGGSTTFYVRDNGVGINPSDAERMFGAFTRLHEASSFEGTGLGLATVERIVTRHGGRVWAEGRRGEGTTLYFTLGCGEVRPIR